MDFDQDKDFLGSAGWQRVGDSSHHYQSVSTPGRFLSGLRRRIQSSMWKLTDEELAAGIAAVEQVIAQEFSGPDDPIVYEMVFRVQRYLPPGS